ncbi:tol-pal system protein YbgF [Reyranella sp.]|uniref:tol-pal system protein YbgF n=1 Tax=Reyranella sp. TaxID=1929291 RepID=UPI00262C9AA5|nr:tol-pal system protein YbgF [Reyranella sp.]HQS14702.1 tol-pal system protein YbgF [Reyranella sp.]HQT12384.1 tol-pal system protein YbgF [Reyranella sp.]
MKILPARLVLLIALALPTAAAAQRGGDAVYIEDRFNQLQQLLTNLTGQLEQLQNRNAKLQQQMEKMQADYEYRIEQLEKGGAARPGGAAPRPPAQAAAPVPTPAAGPANADQLYDEAIKKLQEGDYAAAERGFKTFIQRSPQSKLAGNAQYWLGETYYARRDYKNALTAFAEGYKVYKTSPKGPDNLLKLGITMSVLGRKPDACAVFARFNQDYPRATDLQKRRIEQERQKNGCG